MRYYPVFLDVNGKPVVVVGGGNVALTKVEGLLEAGASVTVVAPELNERMARLKREGRFVHVKRKYEPGDLEGCDLAFAATDDGEDNHRVWEEGRQRHVWVNAVDDIPNCDFIMPGIVRKGDLVLAISTSGTSPAMARKVREDIEEFLTDEDAALLDLAAEIRHELRAQKVTVGACEHCHRNANDVWNAALDGEVKRLLKSGDRPAAKARVLNLLLSPSGQHEAMPS
ncbi:MAG TPA: bifunctional precorrin-2 dehydrogenase/sirohydrochlorin ferrochelatase [Dehalococcoidia bacterium]|nr:bifunctional precorrin-2 dehydrogenase/sirohydrochlorin ferrochelatase [Dehalococcoidia bacterium]